MVRILLSTALLIVSPAVAQDMPTPAPEPARAPDLPHDMLPSQGFMDVHVTEPLPPFHGKSHKKACRARTSEGKCIRRASESLR